MRAKRRPNVTDPRQLRAAPQRPRIPVATILRMFLLGGVSIVAASYAIYRHYTTPYVKMLVPKPSATEIEIEP